MDDLSPLPRSLDPLPGESLPGYVLRLAHRLGLSPARVLQLAGLTGGHLQASRVLMMHLDAEAAGSFARATRLTPAEITCLCMSSMSGRYPQAAPVITSGRQGTRAVTSPWVFTSATRYCPQCLAGDSSPVQRQHGGAWRKTWRLPVVFACPLHHRLLEHLCPTCGQPAMSAPPGGAAFLIPHSTSRGLHPAQCRAVPRPERGARARLCQARLDSPAESPGGDSAVPGDLLALQARLLALLQPDGPPTVISVGRPATAARYFADLRLVCSLISGAWPASRNLIPAPGLADAADDYITGLNSVNPRPYRLCDTPPLDPLPGAAFIAAAARILDGDDLRVIAEFVTPARDGVTRKSPRGRWIRRYQRAGHDCSDGFRDALEPLMHTFQRADQRSHGRRAPARQVSFAPGHIPEHLQDDWFYRHFHHIGGIRPRLLRRAAALRLVQMSAGGSLAEAAAFLGIDHRYIAASPGSSAFADGPAEFRLAVHALASELSTTPDLIDYRHRREALRNWCIDPAAWQDITGQLPRTKGPFQPELSDCKRQFATEVVWARITQGEHVMAPQLIEDQLSRPDPTWNRRRDNMWHFYRAHPLKPHYAALKEILNALADNLAAQIDQRAAAARAHDRSP